VSRVRTALLAAILVVAPGCGPIAIDYRPMSIAPAPAPTASVALQVRNNRPAERGGVTERIGTMYDSSWGVNGAAMTYHGRAVNTTSPDVVTQTVGAAATDALAHAGVSIRSGGALLVATVRDYWFDGHPVHNTDIVVSYDLFDAGGGRIWHADFHGHDSAAVLIGSRFVNLFRNALLEMAEQASEAFRSPDFRAALGRSP
jgi:hypothetical protein